MFGKIRASSSSLESLERPPSKILKDDSLSIYEATLVKLKLGSQRDLSPLSEPIGHIDDGSVSSSACTEPMKIDMSSCPSNLQDSPEFTSSLAEEVMSINTVCYSPVTNSSSRETLLASSPKEQDERTRSILYLFSKFNSAHRAVSLASEVSVSTMENGCSVRLSPSFSRCQSLEWSEEKSEQVSLTSSICTSFVTSELGS